jgi:hypothetical protein
MRLAQRSAGKHEVDSDAGFPFDLSIHTISTIFDPPRSLRIAATCAVGLVIVCRSIGALSLQPDSIASSMRPPSPANWTTFVELAMKALQQDVVSTVPSMEPDTEPNGSIIDNQ